MLNINATEKEREHLAAAARREARKEVVQMVAVVCLAAVLIFGPFYLITGSVKGMIALPALLAARILISGRARSAIFEMWRNRW